MAEKILTRRALNRALLARQMLLSREPVPVSAALERLAGLQAQQARPPFVGLWSRVEGFSRDHLIRLVRDRIAVRATLMRATLHLVTTRDFLALRGAIQPALTAAMQGAVGKHFDGTALPDLLKAAREAFASRPRTFGELREHLAAAFPGMNERVLGYVVRTHLPLAIVPGEEEWGYRADADFVLADAWLGKPVPLESDTEALVRRYLAAFGPATPADARAWSGVAGLQQAFAALRPKLAVFRDEAGRELFDLPGAPRPAEETPAPVRFLADFDNAILGHAERSRIVADEHRPRVITRNLLVPGTVLVDGFVAATWKIAIGKKEAVVSVDPFGKISAATKKEIAAEGEALARFVAPAGAAHCVKFDR